MIRLGLIGLGKWGRRYIETVGEMPNAKLVVAAGREFSSVPFGLPPLDGIILATGPESHVTLAMEAVKQGIPVMIEKPVAFRAADVERLKALAEEKGVPVLVDHTPLFSSNYQNAKRSFDRGDEISIDWLGPGRRDYSPLHDYGAHAISVILDIMWPSEPVRVECETIANDAVFEMRLHFVGTKATAHVGCTDRRNRVLRLYGHRSVGGGAIAEGEPPPLRSALDVFCGLIEGKPDSRSGLELALRVTRVLEECARQVGVDGRRKDS